MADNTDKRKPVRRSIRLPKYDYSQSNIYFITICSYQRKEIFGQVIDDAVLLSPIGRVVDKLWSEIPTHDKSVFSEEYIVMPDHLHGILRFTREDSKTRSYAVQAVPSGSLAAVVRAFKAAVTKQCRTTGLIETVWQRNYYERVIRDEDELRRVIEYIRNNPHVA